MNPAQSRLKRQLRMSAENRRKISVAYDTVKALLEHYPNNIKLGETTIKKIMALNRCVHLAPQRPVAVVEERAPREGDLSYHQQH
jgi:hypothetical protein